MKPEKPDDELEATKPPAKIEARPEVYAINRGQSGWTLSRRSLFSAAAAAAGALPKRARAAACPADAFSHAASVTSIAISPDGRLLASTGDSPDDKIRLWSFPDGALLRTLTGQYRPAGLAFRPDESLLASGSSIDATIKLWSLPDGALLNTLSSNPSSIAITPDGRFLVGGEGNGTTNVWSLPDGTLVKNLAMSPMALAISPDGRLLANRYYSSIQLWSFPDGVLKTTLTGHTDWVTSIAISPDGRLLASGSWDHTIRLWSLPDGALLKTLTGHTDSVNAVAISPDGRLLASGSVDTTIKLWSLPDGAILKTLTANSSSVSSLAVSPDGGMLAAALHVPAQTIKLWSLPDGKPLPVCLMDPAASCSGSGNGVTYTISGVSHTVPGGSPLPPGAVCTCNTVPFSACCSVGGCPNVYWYPN